MRMMVAVMTTRMVAIAVIMAMMAVNVVMVVE